MPDTNQPRILVTAGEPAGIGPDICLALASYDLDAEIIVVCDPDLLMQRAELLGNPLCLEQIQQGDTGPRSAGTLTCLPVPLKKPCVAGTPDPENAEYVLQTLQVAANACMQGWASAMVTAPVNKAIINDAGFDFSGHTEYLAQLTGSPLPVMMLATDKTSPPLRVALATTHLPLRDVAEAINRKNLEQTLRILNHDMAALFGIDSPRIAVCGLNPHAGEGGHLGHEEKDIISPVLEKLKIEGMQLQGPLPADTLFTAKILNNCDAVLAMYHDQGLPTLKYAGFGEAVNITLGLPILRVSVDHGTALDLAGSGQADERSLCTAIRFAARLARHQ